MKKRAIILIVFLMLVISTILVILMTNMTRAITVIDREITGKAVTGKASSQPTNVSIQVILEIPVINLISPADGASSTATAYNFTFNVSDDDDIDNCSLIFDGIIYNTLTNVTKDVTMGMYNSSLSTGSHIWQINCTDSDGNEGNSSERDLTITTPTAAPAGGGRGVRIVSLKIEVPSPISLEETGRLEVPVKLYNDGQVQLNRINITSYVLKDRRESNIGVKLSKSYFKSIGIGKREEIIVTTNINREDISVYEIIINATAESPKYNNYNSIYLNFVGKNASGVEKMIVFAENMVVENPECLELKEMVDEAKEEFEKANFKEAITKANSAVEACRELIAGPKKPFYTFPSKQKAILIFLAIGAIAAIIFGIAFSLYKRMMFRKKFRKKK